MKQKELDKINMKDKTKEIELNHFGSGFLKKNEKVLKKINFKSEFHLTSPCCAILTVSEKLAEVWEKFSDNDFQVFYNSGILKGVFFALQSLQKSPLLSEKVCEVCGKWLKYMEEKQ